MQVGYARVSTPDQSLAVQLEALQQHGCTKIFQEVASGTHAERQGLTAALDYVRPGDTLVVWRLDRLGRSLGQLIVLMNTLHQQQIGFQSVVEVIDTTTAIGQFFFQITGAFAELERNLMRERTWPAWRVRGGGEAGGAAQSHRSPDVCHGAPALRGPHELGAAYLYAPGYCTAHVLS